MTASPTPTPTPAPVPPPVRQRGCLGFAVRSVVGCGAFAIGALVALVLLLPTLLSGFVARRGAAAFDELYAGRLSIDSMSLAWFGRQRVEGARLLDPDGAQVARATIELPSIRALLGAPKGRIGTVVVAVEADLAADDAGVTNLERALTPRRPSPPAAGSPADAGSSFDTTAFLRELELDLRIELSRVAWSDASTRRVGRPFEIQGAVVKLAARPGRPITAHAEGRIAGDAPGHLELDATVHGPLDLAALWPLGRAHIQARVEGFSTAMVDGLAGLAGDLVATVGPTFALRLDVAAESAERATIDVSLDGARAGVGLHAQLADGQITALDKPFLVATLPFPRAILERVVEPHLPPDARLELVDAGRPWTMRVPRLRAPLPDRDARDLASLRPALERAEIDVDVDLPGAWRLETEALRAANLVASASGLRLTARAAPGEPLVLVLETALDAGAPGRVRVDATVPQAFAVLAGAPLAPVDLDVEVVGLSTLAIGELAGQGGRLAAALGPALRLGVEARGASLAGGSVRLTAASETLTAELPARIASGVLGMDASAPARVAWTPPPAFVAAELAPYLPEGAALTFDGPLSIDVPALQVPLQDRATQGLAELDAILLGLAARARIALPALAWTSPQTRAAAISTAVRAGVLDVELQAGAPPRVRFTADVELGEPARLTVDARTTLGLVDLAHGGSTAFAAEVGLAGLSSAALERLAGQDGRLVPVLGPELGLALRFQGDPPREGTLDLALEGALGRVALVARLADGFVRTDADQGLDARLAVTPELLASHVGPSLPAGARLELASGGPAAVVIALHGLATPLEADDLAARLAATSLRLDVELPALRYADANTDAASRPAVLDGARLVVRLAPSEMPTVRFVARVQGDPPGELELDVAALEPLAALGQPEGWRTFRAAASVRAVNVPTALVDALAGQDGLLVEALGPRLVVELRAPDVSFARGAFEARFEGGKNRVTLGGRLDDGTIVVERADGLDANVALGPLVVDRVVGGLLPLLKKASFAVAADRSELTSSTEIAPFSVKSDDLRFALGSDLSKLNGTLRVDLGTLSFRGLPMLEQLGLKVDAGDVRLPAFAVPIRDGVATYTKLPLRIAGRELFFDGTVRLVDGEMALTTGVPLALFGKKFDRELLKVREFVPADTVIPLEIRGSWSSPRVGFQDGYLKNLLEKAAGKAVEKGLGGLLDDLLGGKKKKKDG